NDQQLTQADEQRAAVAQVERDQRPREAWVSVTGIESDDSVTIDVVWATAPSHPHLQSTLQRLDSLVPAHEAQCHRSLRQRATARWSGPPRKGDGICPSSL